MGEFNHLHFPTPISSYCHNDSRDHKEVTFCQLNPPQGRDNFGNTPLCYWEQPRYAEQKTHKASNTELSLHLQHPCIPNATIIVLINKGATNADLFWNYHTDTPTSAAMWVESALTWSLSTTRRFLRVKRWHSPAQSTSRVETLLEIHKFPTEGNWDMLCRNLKKLWTWASFFLSTSIIHAFQIPQWLFGALQELQILSLPWGELRVHLHALPQP